MPVETGHAAEAERLCLVRRHDEPCAMQLYAGRTQPFVRPQWPGAGQIGPDAQIGVDDA